MSVEIPDGKWGKGVEMEEWKFLLGSSGLMGGNGGSMPGCMSLELRGETPGMGTEGSPVPMPEGLDCQDTRACGGWGVAS